jgi:DNA-directed RNA polymerase specialized sigma24 family protein
MVGKGKIELFSEKIAAGSRTYFFDVKESREGVKYLVISESRKKGKEDYKHKRVMIFQEHIPAFAKGLKKALKFAKRSSEAETYCVEEIRQEYPKAYTKWTEDDDGVLREKYLQGDTVDELAKIFQRQPSAIHSRLRKLGLVGES